MDGNRTSVRKGTLLRIAAAAAALLLWAASYGCSKEPTEQIRLRDTADQIQGLEDAPAGALAQAYRSAVTYSVDSVEWQGETGVATLTVTAPDLTQLLSEYIREATETWDGENYDLLLSRIKARVSAALNSDSCPTLKHRLTVEAEKQGEGYRLISNEDFERIVSGDVGRVFARLIAEEYDYE